MIVANVVPALRQKAAVLASVSENRGGWTPWIREPYSGAWQQNDEWTVDTVLMHPAVFTCISRIAEDFGKLRPTLVEQDSDGVWTERTVPSPYSLVLKKPNRYQDHIQFKEWWATSKLTRGNTYALKERDNRGIVRALYILEPSRVTPLVAPDGSVYYQLGTDNLTGITENSVIAPASEIIHDRMNCLFHPLVGVSPIFAAGSAANIGLKVQKNSAGFFGNGSNPGGVLTAPGTIPPEVAQRLKEHWDRNYSGDNAGKIAVLGDSLKFEPMRMSAVDSQLIEQLQWSDKTVCSVFHVPAFKVGIGEMPTYQNGDVLNQIYYSDCLQSPIEKFELCMDEGLGLADGSINGKTLGVYLDLEGLFSMDAAAQMKVLGEGVKFGIMAPNEARRKLNLTPVEGGNTPYLQQQNYPLSALGDPNRAAPELVKPEPDSEPDPEADPGSDPSNDEERKSILAFRVRNRARTIRLMTSRKAA